MFLAPEGAPRIQRAGVAALASALDLCFGQAFERQRREFWTTITTSLPAECPVLILHSEDDTLSPPAFIVRFEAQLKRNGRRNVRRMCWVSSPHVGHLRQHPEQYTSAVRCWLADVQETWRDARGGTAQARHETVTLTDTAGSRSLQSKL